MNKEDESELLKWLQDKDMTLGGEGVRGHTLEGKSKENMINHLKDYYKSHSNPFKGKKHSEDMRAYLSELAKNRTGESIYVW